jgi:hypothetical protein
MERPKTTKGIPTSKKPAAIPAAIVPVPSTTTVCEILAVVMRPSIFNSIGIIPL